MFYKIPFLFLIIFLSQPDLFINKHLWSGKVPVSHEPLCSTETPNHKTLLSKEHLKCG